MSSLRKGQGRNRWGGSMIWMAILAMVGLLALASGPRAKAGSMAAGALEKDPQKVAALLTRADIWIMPQPKETALAKGSFNLKRATGIRFVGKQTPATDRLAGLLTAMLKERSGVVLQAGRGKASGPNLIVLGLFPDGKPTANLSGISADELKGLGEQGYVLHVDKTGVRAAATGEEGLHYAAMTLAQIATDRTSLPGLHIRDWPSILYRGVQQDICRGQVPTNDALKRLARVSAEAKINMLELYIEHTFKFKSHPDTSPPEGITPADASELFQYAAAYHMDVHPLFEVLGHAGTVLKHPQYIHLAVRDKEHPWEITYDIRKPETVAFVLEMIKELHEAMPSKFFTVDITENDAEGFNKTGTTNQQLTKLIYEYMMKIRQTLDPAKTRLIPTQYSLGGEGDQGGLGHYLMAMPKDVVIGMYYSTLPHINSWATDFPRLQKEKRDFFSQPWIYSHNRLMPWTEKSAEFSDAMVSKGVQFGAIGSTTCDWGDEGHYHFVGQEWYPFLYHGACAWTGAKLDRKYFDQAYCRQLFGLKDDAVARAINMATGIYKNDVSRRDAATGKVISGDPQDIFLAGFSGDPWGNPCSTLTDPAAVGKIVLDPATKALPLLEKAMKMARRNQDNIEQQLYGVRNYEAMGRKFMLVAHDRDKNYPPAKLKQEVAWLVQAYETFQKDYQRLWLAEDKDNKQFRDMVGWMNGTIVPCKNKLAQMETQKKK